jgi:hypothetical protein
MGAANAIAAYATYGAVLSDHAMRGLAYMALVARDHDAEPWFGLGWEALAELAFGRKVPSAEDDPQGRKAALRVAERAVAELAAAGAIRTIKRATFGKRGTFPARYRLYLTEPWQGSPPHAKRGMTTPRKTSGGLQFTPHETFIHPTRNVTPPHAKRGTKEEEEKEERKDTGVLPSTREVEVSTNGTVPVDNPAIIISDYRPEPRRPCPVCDCDCGVMANGALRKHKTGLKWCGGSLTNVRPAP